MKYLRTNSLVVNLDDACKGIEGKKSKKHFSLTLNRYESNSKLFPLLWS